MNNKKSFLWLCLAAVFLLAAIGVIWYLLFHGGFFRPEAPAQSAIQDSAAPAELPVPELTFEPAEETVLPEVQSAEEEPRVTPAESEAPYESPVDFEGAWAVNEDICAWLYIPGAGISLPVLQDPEDNTYYLTHDVRRNVSDSGALFIENYNHPDFRDSCTIIYGHRMYSGDMFGTLQATYSSAETFAQSQDIIVYLPDREIAYQVFAAVPFDNSHILYYYNFADLLSYRKFIHTIYSTNGLDAILDPDLEPSYGDRLLVLSTCLWGDKNRRYLVLAKERSE